MTYKQLNDYHNKGQPQSVCTCAHNSPLFGQSHPYFIYMDVTQIPRSRNESISLAARSRHPEQARNNIWFAGGSVGADASRCLCLRDCTNALTTINRLVAFAVNPSHIHMRPVYVGVFRICRQRMSYLGYGITLDPTALSNITHYVSLARFLMNTCCARSL